MGKDRKVFTHDKDLLVERAPYFEKVFTTYGDPKGPQVKQRKASYEDVDVETFVILMKWIWNKDLPKLTATFHKGDKEVQYSGFQPDALYYLAIRFELLTLANHIMDCFVAIHSGLWVGFSPRQIASVFKKTNENSGLRKFVAICLHWEVNCAIIRPLLTLPEIQSVMQVNEICEKVKYIQSGPEQVVRFHSLGNSLCEGHNERENRSKVHFLPIQQGNIHDGTVIIDTLPK